MADISILQLPPTSYVQADDVTVVVQQGITKKVAASVFQGGITGPTGPAGPQGPAGVAGPVGPQGPQGPQGVVGPTGPQGVPGQTGAPGPTGPIGPQGSVGQTGAPGPTGPSGPAGATGATGPKGDTGAQGPQGIQGPQGVKGDKGDTGNTGAAATIAVGTTTTSAPGGAAAVSNSGTSSAAVFDFTIPRGDTGPAGATGAGVATGGTTGQVLAKASNTNYDTSWINLVGGLNYQGNWNASANTPTLTSSVGTNGYYYTVSVAGSTNLNGITDWQVGDWAIFNGTIWQKIDQTNTVTSVNGQTGAVSVGTVTSVAASVPSFLSVSGSPVTTTGTLAITYSGTALPVANGGTGVTSSSGANSVVLRDANGNITTNCLFEGYTTQAASGTTITLTASTAQNYQITGSGGQTIKLPDATTLPNGALFTFNNNQSSGAITVVNNSSTTIATIQSGGYVTVVLLSNSSAAGSWDRHDSTPSNVSWSTNTLDYAGSFTSGTWNGNVIAYNRGGTGQSSLFVAGGIVYGSTTTALAVTAVGTTGQVLTSNGSSAPTWTTPTTGTVTSVSGTTGRITSTGGSTPVIDLASGVATAGTTGSTTIIPVVTIDTYGRVTSITTAANPQGTVTAVTGTSPVVSSGGTTPAISMPAATTSVSGYLTSTDWNTFNNKQPAGTYVNSVSGTTGRITSTGGTTPIIDLASGIATAGTTGSATLIPVITIDTYGRVTSITTAANPQGTVTSVSGTGTVNGLTLTGTVTSSGSLTLGGTLDLSSPPAIGATTPNTIKGTTGTFTSGISGGTF